MRKRAVCGDGVAGAIKEDVSFVVVPTECECIAVCSGNGTGNCIAGDLGETVGADVAEDVGSNALFALAFNVTEAEIVHNVSTSNLAGAVSVAYDTACTVTGQFSTGAHGGYVTEVDVVLAEPDTAGIGCAEGAYDTAGTKVAGNVSVVDVVFNYVGVIEGLSREFGLLGTPSVADDTACVLVAGGSDLTEVLAIGEMQNSLSSMAYDTACVVGSVDITVVYAVCNVESKIVLSLRDDTAYVLCVAAGGEVSVIYAVGDGNVVAL